eukprot:6060208-Amphidinium_carterae.1
MEVENERKHRRQAHPRMYREWRGPYGGSRAGKLSRQDSGGSFLPAKSKPLEELFAEFTPLDLLPEHLGLMVKD